MNEELQQTAVNIIKELTELDLIEGYSLPETDLPKLWNILSEAKEFRDKIEPNWWK